MYDIVGGIMGDIIEINTIRTITKLAGVNKNDLKLDIERINAAILKRANEGYYWIKYKYDGNTLLTSSDYMVEYLKSKGYKASKISECYDSDAGYSGFIEIYWK